MKAHFLCFSLFFAFSVFADTPNGNAQNEAPMPIDNSSSTVNPGNPIAPDIAPSENKNQADSTINPEDPLDKSKVSDLVSDLKSSAKDLYLRGIKAHQGKRAEDSAILFRTALSKEPYNKSILFNLAMVEIELQNFSAAVGYLRRAIYIAPDFSAAKNALVYAKSKLPTPLPNTDLDTVDYLRAHFARKINTNLLLFINLLLLVSSFAILLRYTGQRKQALDDETALPQWPYLGIALALCLFLSAFTAVLKYVDSTEIRATVVEKSVNLYSGPGTENSALFEVFEGYEVVLKKQTPNWTQVSIPGGVSGWVPQKSLFLTTKGLQ